MNKLFWITISNYNRSWSFRDNTLRRLFWEKLINFISDFSKTFLFYFRFFWLIVWNRLFFFFLIFGKIVWSLSIFFLTFFRDSRLMRISLYVFDFHHIWIFYFINVIRIYFLWYSKDQLIFTNFIGIWKLNNLLPRKFVHALQLFIFIILDFLINFYDFFDLWLHLCPIVFTKISEKLHHLSLKLVS